MNIKLKLFLLSSFVFIIVIFLLIFIFSLNNTKKNEPSISPTPSFVMPKNQGADSGQHDPSLSEEEINKRSFVVSGLIDKLPYFGTNFTLSYSFSGANFILYINPKEESAGNSEFDLFLKKNGIDSRSWVENLFITSLSPTPTGVKK